MFPRIGQQFLRGVSFRDGANPIVRMDPLWYIERMMNTNRSPVEDGMAEKRFDLVFRGEIQPGHDPEKVKKALASMLKLDSGRIEEFFSGDPAVIRKGLDKTTAAKYQGAIGRTGAVCEIVDGAGSDPPERDPLPAPRKTMPMRPGVFVITNIETVPGREIVEHFGLVSGSTIRAEHLGRDIMTGLKNLVGGELRGYTERLQDSRKQAVDRMKEEARKLGGNAVVNVRFSTSAVARGAAELYVYGTAVRVE